MQRRILNRLALAAGLLGLVACGGGGTPAASVPAQVPPQAAATVPATPSPESVSQAVVAFEEAPCPMDLPPGAREGEHITCGYVNVPELRGPPAGKTIRLAVAVIHSASNTLAPAPLFMLAGGPGESALTSFVQLLALPGMESFWVDRDVVLVEQRGTRYSTPFLRCVEMHELKLDLLGENLGDEEEEARKLDAWTACHDRLVAEGINPAAYNSVENAADVVAVADALGYAQIDLYGGSYGSLLAQHIMRDYPDRVRCAILDAVSPLRHEPNMLYKAHATDRALRLLFAYCQGDPACSQAYPDLDRVYFDLVAQRNKEPALLQIQDPDTGEVYDMLLTGDRLIAQTRDLLYITPILPDLPGVIYDMAQGDFSLLTLVQSQFMFQLNLADGMYNSVVCAELADFTGADMADATGLYPQVAGVVEDLIDEVMLQPCQVWGVQHLGDWISESVTGDTPVLLLSGEFDPTVPPDLAKVAAENLSNAYLYTFPAVGHTVFGTGDCAQALMLAFLEDPTRAPDGTCLAESPGLAFRLPAATQGVELEPYTSAELGIRGVAPGGWTEAQAGILVRGDSAVDQTALVYDVVPMSAGELLGIIAQQFGLEEVPESSGERQANGLTWALYEAEAQGYPIDIALVEKDDVVLVILLVTAADEHDALSELIFLPAVDALAALD